MNLQLRDGWRKLLATLVVAGAALAWSALPATADTMPEVEKLSSQTAKKIAKTYAHRFLTTPLQSCFRASELCAQLDAALQAELAKAIPEAQFIPRDEAMKHLASHGFMKIDAYLGALDDVATDAGVEVVISEGFQRRDNDCELQTTVIDAKHLFELDDLSVHISCRAIAAKVQPTLLKADGAEVALIVAKPLGEGTAPDPTLAAIRAPRCQPNGCPAPQYSSYARNRRIEGIVRVVMTVNESGVPENPVVIGGVEDSLVRTSLEALQNWRFTPAVGVDGKPFPVRIPIVLNFRMRARQPMPSDWPIRFPAGAGRVFTRP